MKVDIIIKISDQNSQPMPLDELYYKKTLCKIISITKYVKHPQSCFLNKSQSDRIGGYSHIMTKNWRDS